MPIFNQIRINLTHLGRVLAQRHDDFTYDDTPVRVFNTAIVNTITPQHKLPFSLWQQHINAECSKIRCSSKVIRESNHGIMYTYV